MLHVVLGKVPKLLLAGPDPPAPPSQDPEESASERGRGGALRRPFHYNLGTLLCNAVLTTLGLT